MAIVNWITPKGDLGTYSESQFVSIALEASDIYGSPLFFSHISGELPFGVYVTRDGIIKGVPTLVSPVSQKTVFTFTIRATNENGQVADRSFTIVVSNVQGPQITPRPDLIGAWFDGTLLEYQFNAVSDNLSSNLTYTIISGSLPPGVSLTTAGKLYGYVGIISETTTSLYYEGAPVDTVLYEAQPISSDRFYNFILQVTDGFKFDTVSVRLLVVSKGSFTADNLITLINNTFINVDADNEYRPIILNEPGPLPLQVAGTNFAYKFLAYDPEDEVVKWQIDELAFSGMDDLDKPLTQSWNGIDGTIEIEDLPLDIDGGDASVGSLLNGIKYQIVSVGSTDFTLLGATSNTVGEIFTYNGVAGSGSGIARLAYTLLESIPATRLVIYKNNSLLVPNIDYTVTTVNLFFTVPLLLTDVVSIAYVSTNTGFDSLLFDQGALGLPVGLTIDEDTGWVSGTLPVGQFDDITEYEFRVYAYRATNSALRSDQVTFIIRVKRSLNDEIVWLTDSDLGVIDNGSISELTIQATHTLGEELIYTTTYQPYRKIPQGLKLLETGRLSGRVTFRFFSLDGDLAWINVGSTADLEVGMTVQGVGVAAGCKISQIIDSNTIEVQPAIYVVQGSILTFSNEETTEVLATTTNAISTVLDGGTTTFDQLSQFSVRATTKSGSISSVKSFTVLVRPYNLAPYENIYLRALLPEDQRTWLTNLLANENYIPKNLIYRIDDPYFGIAKNLKILFAAGLSAAVLSRYVTAMTLNHYNKTINFGNLKTAVAKDSNGNVIYEVIYIEAIDTQSVNNQGPPLEVNLDITNNFLYLDNEYDTIYPNSFNNMITRIENTIGYSNKGALPRWMTTTQEDGKVLGFTRGVVLVYTQPNASKLIKYRLEKNADILGSSFIFEADRYQIENFLSKYYNVENNRFNPSVDTTFDKYPNLAAGDLIITTIENSVVEYNQITIPENVVVGQGWYVESRDQNSDIPIGTVAALVQNNIITLSSNITASSGAAIRFDGIARVDYAVKVSFNTLNGCLVSFARENFLVDGWYSFLEYETIIFSKQTDFDEFANGWVDQNDVILPGYLEKITGASTVNKRSSTYRLNFVDVPTIGFDSDLAGFDDSTTDLYYSRFDQGDDQELQLEFISEILLEQTVKVRSGKTYPSSTLVYRAVLDESTPRFVVFEGELASLETTFDGGSCSCREGENLDSRRGGTAFSNNRDKYVIPETEDKYIKFPQIGVFI